MRNRPGVYLIYKNDVLRYIGNAGRDIYTTMYRHFQSWDDRRQFRAVYDRARCKVRVIYTNTAKQAQNLETALIVKHQPKDNDKKLQTALNFRETDILKEYIQAPTATVAEYKEAWD